MTKEEIRKVLDLALEYYKLEIFGTGKESQPQTQERIDYIYDRMQQSLPSDLDEAAEKYGHEEPILPEDYNDGDIPDYERWTAEAFKAGAEWMAGQGINMPAHIFMPSGIKSVYDHSKGEYPAAVHLDCGGSLVLERRLQNFNHNEEVIVQIRKK